jgi:catechol O-methyltransferase
MYAVICQLHNRKTFLTSLMKPNFPNLILLLVSSALLFELISLPSFVPVWIVWFFFGLTLVIAVNNLLGNPIPFLRWSFIRVLFGMKELTTNWQVGDGREQRVGDTVLKKAKKGDAADVVRVIDNFAYNSSMLINVGDKKGAILDGALQRAKPKVILELGAYVGYSATRMGQQLPTDGRLYSIEFSPKNATIARSIIDHAGLTPRVTIVVGILGDGGKTADLLEKEHGFGPGYVDFVFIDHAKEAYLPDLQLIINRGWLHKGSVVVADNIKFPGAPEYQAYMTEQEGKLWKTRAHKSFVEYQSLIPDIVLESEYQA